MVPAAGRGNTGKGSWILHRVVHLLSSSKGIPGLVYKGLVSRQSLARVSVIPSGCLFVVACIVYKSRRKHRKCLALVQLASTPGLGHPWQVTQGSCDS